jgi:hypothetical protein
MIIAKGLNILRNVKDLGLVIAPEIVEWKQPLIDGTHRTTRLRQKRISFTELARSQVAEHGKNLAHSHLNSKSTFLGVWVRYQLSICPRAL